MGFSATRIGTPAIFAFSDNNKSLSVRGRIVDVIQHTAAEHLSIYEELEETVLQHTPDFIEQVFNIRVIQTFQNWVELVEDIPGTLRRSFSRTSFFHTLNHAGMVDQEADREALEAWLHCFSSPTTPQLQTLLEHTSSDSGSNLNATACKQLSTQVKGEAQLEAECDAIWNRIIGSHKAQQLHLQIYHQCRRTRLLITSNGYLGKGLKDIQESDFVVLIAGVDMPMILRKDGDSYCSMGPAYIDGMMYGEMWPKDEKDLIDIVLI